jgi:4a-hydroxytetrahydrobiopterin dehydratase
MHHHGFMTDLLTDTQIQAELTGGLAAWHQAENALERTAELPSFPEAIQAVNRIAEIAESSDHHPDIDIRWRNLTFRCSTHSEGGITAKDVQLATEIDGVLDALGG